MPDTAEHENQMRNPRRLPGHVYQEKLVKTLGVVRLFFDVRFEYIVAQLVHEPCRSQGLCEICSMRPCLASEADLPDPGSQPVGRC